MSSFREPFSKAEMSAMKRALKDEKGVLSEAKALLLRIARQIPFAREALAAVACVRDPSTPHRVRFILLAALAYLVMPFDAIPDLIPILGYSDDAAFLAAAIANVRGSMTDAHYAEADRMLGEEISSDEA